MRVSNQSKNNVAVEFLWIMKGTTEPICYFYLKFLYKAQRSRISSIAEEGSSRMSVHSKHNERLILCRTLSEQKTQNIFLLRLHKQYK